MSITVCLAANTIDYPAGGGHAWAYLNWALGLRGLGCRVFWLEVIQKSVPPAKAERKLAALAAKLDPFGLAADLAVVYAGDQALKNQPSVALDEACEADFLLSLRYGLSDKIVQRFPCSALLDIDPGLFQTWLASGQVKTARYDLYLTTGETVGRAEAHFPDAGLQWLYVPPCIALDWWPVKGSSDQAAFTTVSHWDTDEWVEDAAGSYLNDKRSGFLPFLSLPLHTAQKLELALCLEAGGDQERRRLETLGWRLRDAWSVASTPADYQHYIQESRGEFSCVKPSCLRLQNAWVSDRSLCYLASGKPVIAQHTGPSRFLPDAAGMHRFRTLEEAASSLERVAANYEQECLLARALAEEHFDARKVARRVLELGLG
jgi:hypothetical protein